MVHTAVSSKTETLTAVNARTGGTSRLSRFLQGDYAPVLLLSVVIIGLAGTAPAFVKALRKAGGKSSAYLFLGPIW